MPTFAHLKVLSFETKSMDADLRIVRGLASTPTLDRQGEIVEPTAFTATLASYLRNPVVTWGHRVGDLPIGRTLEAAVTPEGLQVAIQFGTHTFASEVWQAVQDGLVKSLSIGFDGEYSAEFGRWDKEADAWRWTKLDLWEIAVCSVPACPDATFSLAKSLGMQERPDRETLKSIGHEEAVAEPPQAKNDATVSFATNVAVENAEEAIEEQRWRLMDGLWGALMDTIEAILAFTGDRAPLIDQLGLDLAAELKRRLADLPTTEPASPGPYAILSRALEELTARKNGLPKQTEEERVLANIQRLANAAESIRNFTRHATRDGGAPSAQVVDAALRPIGDLCEIVEKAGRVLSGANRQIITDALSALQSGAAALQALLAATDDAPAETEGAEPKSHADGCDCGASAGTDETPQFATYIPPEIPTVAVDLG